MNEAIRRSETEADFAAPSVNNLVSLYDGTMEELRRCASINPAHEEDEESADLRESSLLDLEADLLDQAASIQLRTKEDIEGLMDIWSKSSSIQSSERPSPSDRIAMNIFRHMSDGRFSKS